MTLMWESGEWANDAATMEALVEMYKAVGVTLKLKEFQPGGDINTWRLGKGGDWDLLGNGYGNQTGLALTNIQGMFGGTAESEKTGQAYLGFVFPEISAQIQQATATSDEAARNAILAQVQKDVWAQAPIPWAFVPDAILAHRRAVSGIDLAPINSYGLPSVQLR